VVHEILELAQSSYGRFPEGDTRRVLVDAWRGLAHVYGEAGSSANREMNRLVMMTYWAEAIQALHYSGFPGLPRMVAAYQVERRRLELAKLRPDLHDFKHVGALLNLLKVYEPRPRHSRSATASKLRAVDSWKPAACRSGQSIAIPASLHDRPSRRTMETLANELYGNWRDHWRNTLPQPARV
jgi:hypothetical protein